MSLLWTAKWRGAIFIQRLISKSPDKHSSIPLGTRLPRTEFKPPHDTHMRRLTTGIHSKKRVVWRFRRCANVTQCTYTNLDSIAYYTRSLYGTALLLLGYKPVQHVTVLNTAANCNTTVSTIILWEHSRIRGPTLPDVYLSDAWLYCESRHAGLRNSHKTRYKWSSVRTNSISKASAIKARH